MRLLRPLAVSCLIALAAVAGCERSTLAPETGPTTTAKAADAEPTALPQEGTKPPWTSLPGAQSDPAPADPKLTATLAEAARSEDMVLIPGGTYAMGTNAGSSQEAPVHQVRVDAFWIDRYEVTVGEFAKFVVETGYVTESERYGWSGFFDVKTGKWKKSDGANWQHPEGPDAVADSEEPVCQVTWNDAVAYCKWIGKRLPTEAEWEHAARGGLEGQEFAWGKDLRPGGKVVANWWQGRFPDAMNNEDGYLNRAPVGQFPANGYGLYDITGNVWEWTADWLGQDYYARSPVSNPQGPPTGRERTIRGGSWMCSENFCTGFRVAARMGSEPDSGLVNLGFRCARDR